MSWAAVIVGGATLVGGAMSSRSQRRAADSAADAQSQASAAEIEERRRQFDAVQELLRPYVDTGRSALDAQGDMAGLNGADAQHAAMLALQRSPQFGALVNQGEEAILQNASATGGLRGGNVQGALAQFRPTVLSALIDQQFGRLGGLSSMGANAAAGVGNAGLATAGGIGSALQAQGAAQAGAALARGQASAGMWNTVGNVAGMFAGAMGGGMGGGAGGGGMTVPQNFKWF